ncbi:peptidoglycan DD-metalloendopeptidase family protein [Aliiroseovarius subalbicans]|uniref:peptidoglycan DD-metalloendopeptidase family protein n=1 Tax=Aliiroseovarius subalbicans TaxID=2925840 RepID=UPI001F55EF51|nr:peptidoglycan DD-metalloendopeptidase family protein [Aliiroseovarius subalbicans]MCI2398681.1 peptidoglycan DD-metalloendopeptidase family protein [Aliiroseovarius subalbicans]
MPFPTPNSRPLSLRLTLMGSALILLSACETGFDLDMRRFGDGFNTSQATQTVTAERPRPDARGIISYPNYQVAVARRGDTLASLAARIGVPAADLARFNGIPTDAALRKNELVALPRRVSETATGPIQPADTIDITTLAGDAIDRAGSPSATQPAVQTGEEPVRHQVARGETAYSIARLYGVSVRALADWNGLGAALTVREGQYLLIPVKAEEQPRQAAVSTPGQGSTTPTPPSAAKPLPDEVPAAAATSPDKPDSPDLAGTRTAASASRMALPVAGKIIRAFAKGKTDGIDISASAGTRVNAAANGTVAAITRDTDQVPILVIRHPNNVLTVYANIDNIAVKKGDTVKRGQKIATVRAGEPAFLHFQVREGTTSVDPMPYLN